MAYGSIEDIEVRNNNVKIEVKAKVEEKKNEEQSNETIEHLPNSEIRRSQRNQIIGKKELCYFQHKLGFIFYVF